MMIIIIHGRNYIEANEANASYKIDDSSKLELPCSIIICFRIV